jgi:hypothetical protein
MRQPCGYSKAVLGILPPGETSGAGAVAVRRTADRIPRSEENIVAAALARYIVRC